MSAQLRPQAADPALPRHPAFDVALAGFDWIEANAGSGKTWTITALAARAIVEREADARGLVVITFTRAAAAELRTRIRRRLADLRAALDAALGGRPGPQDAFATPYVASIAREGRDASQSRDALERARRRILAALASVDEMTVSTIHGFAQKLLAEFGPSFGAPDDARFGVDLSDVQERVQAAFWRARTASADSALVEAIGADCPIVGAVRRRLASALRQPLARLEPQPGDPERAALRWRQAWAALRDTWRDCGEATIAAVLAHPSVNKASWRADYVPARRAAMDSLFRAGNPWRARPDLSKVEHFGSAKLRAALRVAPGEPLPLAPSHAALADAADALLEAAPAFWDEVPDLLAGLWRAEATEGLEAAKRRAQRFDHDDALRLLADGLEADAALGARIAARYPFLFLDEAQDTDPLQWSVFERIWLRPGSAARVAARGAMVAVGDPKQAIYAFRDADVYAYLAARERFSPTVHTLADNRRSVPALVRGVNALFSRAQAFVEPRIGYVGSTSPDGHDAGALDDPHDPLGAAAGPLRVLRFGDKDDEPRVAWCADEIARLLDAARGAAIRRPDGARARVEPRDVGVLVRTAREGAMVRDALRARGIGSVEVSNASVLDADEARDLQDLVAAIAMPDDATLLRAALATPLMSADAQPAIDALDADGAARRSLPFREARRRWLRSGPMAALHALLAQADAPALLGALPDGERRLANVRHLLEVLQAALPATRTPEATLAWLPEAARRGAEDTELRLDDDASLVRISTIHKSKGLEYPIVFLPFAPEMARDSRARPDAHDYPVWHDEHAALGAVIDLRTERPPEVEARIRLERAAEQVRLAYVALTRACLRCTVAWSTDKAHHVSAFGWLLHGADLREPKPVPDAAAAERSLAALQALAPGCLAVADAAEAASGGRSPGSGGAAPGDPAPGDPASGPEAAGARLQARPFTGTIAPPLARLNFTALRPHDPDAQADGLDAATLDALASLLDERDRDAMPAGIDPGVTGPGGSPAPAPFVPGGRTTSAAGLALDGAPGDAIDPDMIDMDAIDPDAIDPDDEEAAAEAAAAARDIRWRFPVGDRAGSCLHEVFELADLAAGITPADCEAALRRWGFAELAGDAAQVAAWLDAVLAAPLPLAPAFALRDAAGRCLRELEFQLPVHAEARALESALRAWGPVRPLGARRLRGALRGFVDAVIEHDGKLWVVDWKSSWLGERPADYDATSLSRAMDAGGYRLQAALYGAAITRWMRRRRPGWEPASGYGGAIYVFLRGAGAGAGAGAGGQVPAGCGFHVERHDPDAIARLADAFDALDREPPGATAAAGDIGSKS